jgi:DNA-binding MarR family transcriptional regulator
MKPQETVDYNIKACWHAIARMYNNEAARHDMTMAIGYVLLNIDAEIGTPATKIAPQVGLETRSLTRMLKTLEAEGFISRVADEKDRRGVNIFLTEKGKQKREIARQTVRHFNFLVRENVPPEKLQVFFEVINEINKLIEPKTRRQMIVALQNEDE